MKREEKGNVQHILYIVTFSVNRGNVTERKRLFEKKSAKQEESVINIFVVE